MHFRSILPRCAVGLAALAYCVLARSNGLFPTSNYVAANSPSGVVLADVNGDGKLDAIVVGADGSVAVYLGDGNGALSSPTAYYATNGNATAVAVADVNGDGKPDLLVVNASTNTVSVLLGNGDGTFKGRTMAEAAAGTGTQAPTYAVGKGPFAIAVGDINGDGKPDLVVANFNDNTLSILLNNGDGTFKTQTTLATGVGPDCVNLADFNGDGKLDILVTNSTDGTLGMYLNNGDGTFKAPTLTSVNPAVTVSTLETTVVGDLNHDGKLDVVTTLTSSTATTVLVLLGNGDGTFASPLSVTAARQARYLALADVDGDGILDIIDGSFIAGTVNVLHGHGDGSFDPGVSYSAPGISSAVQLQAFAVGDLNNSGKPDIVAINPAGSLLQVLVNDGTGKFHPPHTTLLGNEPAAVAAADLNGDGKQDLVEANTADGTVEVLLGNGDGTFQSAVTYPVGSHPQRLKLVDVNGDGKLDILVGNYGDNTIGVLLGNGDGTFQAMKAYPAGNNLMDFDVGDMDKDGKLDLVVANAVTNMVGILKGNGDGSFQAPVLYPAGTLINALAVGDVNHDGFPDVVAVGSSVAVLMNDGHGALLPIVRNSDGTSANLYTAVGVRVALADVENRGQLDILINDYSNSQLVVFSGDSLGSFQPAEDYPSCANPTGMAVADMNADGNLDVVVACSGSNSISVLLGNGKGGFISTPYTAELEPRGVAIADFNGDGQPDVAVVNGGSDTLNLLLEKTGVVTNEVAPVAVDGHNSVGDGKNPIQGQMLASDNDGDALTFGIVTPSSNSSISFSASSGAYAYLANQGFVGTDSFQFQATDGVKLSNVATVSIEVATNTAGQSSSGGHGFLGAFGLPLLPLLLPLALWRRRRRGSADA